VCLFLSSYIKRFLSIGGQALYVNMDNYLQGIFTLATDSAAEVRKLVCHALKLFVTKSLAIVSSIIYIFIFHA
jgi:hypothetical protein